MITKISNDILNYHSTQRVLSFILSIIITAIYLYGISTHCININSNYDSLLSICECAEQSTAANPLSIFVKSNKDIINFATSFQSIIIIFFLSTVSSLLTHSVASIFYRLLLYISSTAFRRVMYNISDPATQPSKTTSDINVVIEKELSSLRLIYTIICSITTTATILFINNRLFNSSSTGISLMLVLLAVTYSYLLIRILRYYLPALATKQMISKLVIDPVESLKEVNT